MSVHSLRLSAICTLTLTPTKKNPITTKELSVFFQNIDENYCSNTSKIETIVARRYKLTDVTVQAILSTFLPRICAAAKRQATEISFPLTKGPFTQIILEALARPCLSQVDNPDCDFLVKQCSKVANINAAYCALYVSGDDSLEARLTLWFDGYDEDLNGIISDSEVRAALRKIDANGNGKVSPNEFVQRAEDFGISNDLARDYVFEPLSVSELRTRTQGVNLTLNEFLIGATERLVDICYYSTAFVLSQADNKINARDFFEKSKVNLTIALGAIFQSKMINYEEGLFKLAKKVAEDFKNFTQTLNETGQLESMLESVDLSDLNNGSMPEFPRNESSPEAERKEKFAKLMVLYKESLNSSNSTESQARMGMLKAYKKKLAGGIKAFKTLVLSKFGRMEDGPRGNMSMGCRMNETCNISRSNDSRFDGERPSMKMPPGLKEFCSGSADYELDGDMKLSDLAEESGNEMPEMPEFGEASGEESGEESGEGERPERRDMKNIPRGFKVFSLLKKLTCKSLMKKMMQQGNDTMRPMRNSSFGNSTFDFGDMNGQGFDFPANATDEQKEKKKLLVFLSKSFELVGAELKKKKMSGEKNMSREGQEEREGRDGEDFGERLSPEDLMSLGDEGLDEKMDEALKKEAVGKVIRYVEFKMRQRDAFTVALEGRNSSRFEMMRPIVGGKYTNDSFVMQRNSTRCPPNKDDLLVSPIDEAIKLGRLASLFKNIVAYEDGLRGLMALRKGFKAVQKKLAEKYSREGNMTRNETSPFERFQNNTEREGGNFSRPGFENVTMEQFSEMYRMKYMKKELAFINKVFTRDNVLVRLADLKSSSEDKLESAFRLARPNAELPTRFSMRGNQSMERPEEDIEIDINPDCEQLWAFCTAHTMDIPGCRNYISSLALQVENKCALNSLGPQSEDFDGPADLSNGRPIINGENLDGDDSSDDSNDSDDNN